MAMNKAYDSDSDSDSRDSAVITEETSKIIQDLSVAQKFPF